MLCNSGKSKCFPVAIVVIALLLLAFAPTKSLLDKPANPNPDYVTGWKDGCQSGANSNALFAVFLDKPFIEQDADTTKQQYKNAWNEGYTVCRFYQATIYSWAQTLLIVAGLLFLGCRKAKDA